MKIGIVGTGISGLVCARLLHGAHEIEVFEADARIGGHTHTVDVELEGERYAVDTGFIVYNQRTYPNFVRLLDRLGVVTRPSDMSFSVACEKTGIEWGSRTLNAVFAQRRNLLRPSFLRMLGDVLRFNRESRMLLEIPEEKTSLGDYLCGAGYSREFVDHYVIPMGAAIWSADPHGVLQFPAVSFVRFFANHGLLDRRDPIQWRVIEGGSARYVERLVAPFRDRIRLACPVRAVRRRRSEVQLAAGGELHRFDRVILAVHSDQALQALADPSESERRILGSIRYQANDVVLHTDPGLLPRNRRAWASWNYRVPRATQASPLVTYHMNRLQGLDSPHDFFVTLNGSERVRPERVLGRYRYAHPVLDADAIAVQKLHHRIDGSKRTHYCGAGWGYGFHEDGVKSALAVCRKLGVDL